MRAVPNWPRCCSAKWYTILSSMQPGCSDPYWSLFAGPITRTGHFASCARRCLCGRSGLARAAISIRFWRESSSEKDRIGTSGNPSRSCLDSCRAGDSLSLGRTGGSSSGPVHLTRLWKPLSLRRAWASPSIAGRRSWSCWNRSSTSVWQRVRVNVGDRAT